MELMCASGGSRQVEPFLLLPRICGVRVKAYTVNPLPCASVCLWLQVEPFLLVPRRSGENERERRKELLRRRNEHIQLTGGPLGTRLGIG